MLSRSSAAGPPKPQGQCQWLPLRKGVADMSRGAQLSHPANRRYLQALSKIDAGTPLYRVADKLFRPVWDERGRRHRALDPLAAEDAQLPQVISRAQFHITGFRNRDVRQVLFGEASTDEQRHRQASRVTRKFALLRAHGLIRKVSKSHRYLLTTQGLTAAGALLGARNATLDQLTTAA